MDESKNKIFCANTFRFVSVLIDTTKENGTYMHSSNSCNRNNNKLRNMKYKPIHKLCIHNVGPSKGSFNLPIKRIWESRYNALYRFEIGKFDSTASARNNVDYS